MNVTLLPPRNNNFYQGRFSTTNPNQRPFPYQRPPLRRRTLTSAPWPRRQCSHRATQGSHRVTSFTWAGRVSENHRQKRRCAWFPLRTCSTWSCPELIRGFQVRTRCASRTRVLGFQAPRGLCVTCRLGRELQVWTRLVQFAHSHTCGLECCFIKCWCDHVQSARKLLYWLLFNLTVFAVVKHVKALRR